jgi:hypothetical protein
MKPIGLPISPHLRRWISLRIVDYSATTSALKCGELDNRSAWVVPVSIFTYYENIATGVVGPAHFSILINI